LKIFFKYKNKPAIHSIHYSEGLLTRIALCTTLFILKFWFIYLVGPKVYEFWISMRNSLENERGEMNRSCTLHSFNNNNKKEFYKKANTCVATKTSTCLSKFEKKKFKEYNLISQVLNLFFKNYQFNSYKS